MVWNSTWPDGSRSVQDNRPTGQQNTTYIETTSKRDHFFNEGADIDGHHKSINQRNVAVDPNPTAGMNGVTFLKQATGESSQKFFNNGQQIYQQTPTVLIGKDKIFPDTQYYHIVNVPNDTFGTIWIYQGGGFPKFAIGNFVCSGGVCNAFSSPMYIGVNAVPSYHLRFGNAASSNGLSLRAAARVGSVEDKYRYQVFYYNILIA